MSDERLRKLGLDELAEEMGNLRSDDPALNAYSAEFARRHAVHTRWGSIISSASLVVSALAIVIGTSWAVDRVGRLSDEARAFTRPPCRLPTLPTDRDLTIGDLEAGYIERGAALVECDMRRGLAVEMLELRSDRGPSR